MKEELDSKKTRKESLHSLINLIPDLNQVRNWAKPDDKKRFPIVMMPFFVTFLASVFLFDLALSHVFTVSRGEDFLAGLGTRQFDIEVLVVQLISWGGLHYLTKGTAQRYLTYSFHHFNLAHIIGNSILLTLSMYMLEERYGAFRLLVIGVSSAFSGSLISWLVYRGQDKLLAGASAIAYGFLGVFIGDMILNWEHYRQRLIWVSLLVAGTIISIVIEGTALPSVSAISHASGVVTSILVSLLILPNYQLPMYEKVLKGIAAFLLVCEFLIIPLVIAYVDFGLADPPNP